MRLKKNKSRHAKMNREMFMKPQHDRKLQTTEIMGEIALLREGHTN